MPCKFFYLKLVQCYNYLNDHFQAAKIACDKLKERMKPVAEKMEAAKWHEIVQACFFNGVDLCARHMGHSINDKLKGYTIWCAVLTEVEIDVLTGERNILRTDLIEDTGATINPEVDIGQIEGAYVFGLGWWMTEQIKHDPVTGQLLTADTWVKYIYIYIYLSF